MTIIINDNNYADYKKIFEIFWKHASKHFDSKLFLSKSPIVALNEFELESKLIAKRSLKAGLIDIISQLKYLPSDLRRDIESDLAKNNLPSTYSLQATSNNTVTHVLKRKKINNLEEYYAVKELVGNIENEIAIQDLNLLNKYLVKFEHRQTT